MKVAEMDFMSEVKAICERSTGGLANKVCEVRFAPKVNIRNDDGTINWTWGEGRKCSAPIFLSRETGRELQCGECAIREIDCITQAKIVRRMQMSMDTLQPDDAARPFFSNRIELAIRALSMQVEMSGCDARNVYASAGREIKREDEWAERNKDRR